MLDFLGTLQRTHTCGELRAQQAGDQVILMGWVNRRRDHGNLIFLDLRDRSGITQIVLDKDLTPEGHGKAEHVRPEYVVAVVGKVRLRGAEVINPKMATGEIEVAADRLLVLNDSRVAPFSPAEEAIANEELRLKYRYIDLRRQQMQQNFELRHKISRASAGEPLQPGVSGDRDAVHDAIYPGRRTRLPGPEPSAWRPLLCSAAVAPVVQTDPHDLGLRSLFPDCALLPG